MMQEKISVVIPIYNVERFLDRTINAVISQTYENLEIILVDDGSTDKSGQICDDYAKKDNRIIVIHKENGGSSSARNAGIDRASGDYIGFLDSDDWAEPDMYENLYNALKTHDGANVVQIMSRDFDEAGNLVKPPYKETGNTVVLSNEQYFKELMLHVGDSSFCTKILEKNLMKKYKFREHELNEDVELLIRMLPEFHGVVSIEKPGYNIELRGGSNTRGKYNQAFYEAMIRNANTSIKMAENTYPELLDYAKRFYIVQASFFLLNIPIEYMTNDNESYVALRNQIHSKDMRKQIRTNPYIEKKIRRNMLVLAYFPTRGARKVHAFLMKLRGNNR